MTAILASDAERERIAHILEKAAGDGRLTPEEAGERLALASAARHRDELARLVSDLPEAAKPRRYWGGALARGIRLAVFAAIVLMVWKTGAWVFFAFWPLILGGLAFGVVRRARWRYARWQYRYR
jgi:uncharacterized protein DUF1707